MKKLASIIALTALVFTLGMATVHAQPQAPAQTKAHCGGGWGHGGGYGSGGYGGNGGWGCNW